MAHSLRVYLPIVISRVPAKDPRIAQILQSLVHLYGMLNTQEKGKPYADRLAK